MIGQPRNPAPHVSNRVVTQLWQDGLGRVAVRSAQLLLVLSVIGVLAFVAVQLRLVVVPVLIATLIAAAVSPLVVWLVSHRVPRAIAVWIALITGLGLLLAASALIAAAVRNQWDELRQGAVDGFAELQAYLTSGRLGLKQSDLDGAVNQVSNALGGSQVQAGAIGGLTLIGEVIAGGFLGLVVLYFLLKDGDRIWAFLRDQTNDRHHYKLDAVATRSVEVLGGYVRGTALIALVDAVIIGVALAVLGVPLALPLATIVFIGAFIPLIGATVAGALAALIALISNGPVTALIVLGVVIAVNQIEGDVLAPIVLGRSLSLHPLAILLALTAGTITAGIIGAILGVPFAAVAWAAVSTLRELPQGSTSDPYADQPTET